MTFGYSSINAGVLPDKPLKGRGAVSNRSGRYEPEERAYVDDGWLLSEERLEENAPSRTELGVDTARKVITRNDSPDVPFDRSINPYRGCEHGCVYCFARPTHAYLGLSPGLDFETKLFWKPEAADLLRAELSKKSYKCAPIAFGTNTDPYQPIERDRKATRSLLEVLAETKHPFSIVTKNALVLRDLDLIAPAARERRAKVILSVTTLDRHLANKMEPRASTPTKRLHAIRELAAAGVPTGVLVAPIIPAINDHEMEEITARCVELGARSAGYVMLRLPLEIKDLMREWLEAHYPDRADRVFSLIRQTRNGGLYQAEFGKRMRGTGPYADMIAKRFSLIRKRHDLDGRSLDGLDCNAFIPPRKASAQMDLF